MRGGGSGYPRDGLVVLWTPSDGLALYDGYLGATYVFCSDDVVCGDWAVSDLIFLNGFL